MRKGRGCGAEGEMGLDSQSASDLWFIRWVLRISRLSADHCWEAGVAGDAGREDLEDDGRPLYRLSFSDEPSEKLTLCVPRDGDFSPLPSDVLGRSQKWL